MATVDDLMEAMSDNVGRYRGISARHLAARLDIPVRAVRRLIGEANLSGRAVGGHPRTGYFIASTPAEAMEIADHLIDRAKFSLLRASRILGKPIRELAGQIDMFNEKEAAP